MERRLSRGGGFERGLSCEYPTLYGLDSSDLIYRNEVIQPPGKTNLPPRESIRPIRGPAYPFICHQCGRGGGVCSYRAVRPPGAPHHPVLPGPLNPKGPRRLPKDGPATGSAQLAVSPDLGDGCERRRFRRTKPRLPSELGASSLLLNY